MRQFYIIQIDTGDLGNPLWLTIRDSQGEIYKYKTEEEAQRMLNISYPRSLEYKTRVVFVDNSLS
jgi:hypothetical protein